MPDDEVTLDEIYAECDKRIAAAIAALDLDAKIKAAVLEALKKPEPAGMRILRNRRAAS
jgi:hypothetical protein